VAFPQVAATNNSFESANATTHTVNLPANISSGDLLLIFFATDGDHSVSNWSGFTEIFTLDNGTAAGLSVAYKNASGSEGSSVDITTNESEQSAHISWRVTGWDTGQAPEASSGNTGNDANPDPDELDPTGAAKDFLWIAVEGNDDDDNASAYPLPDNNATRDSVSANNSCNVAVCSDELNQATLNPGTFTIPSEQWVACTVAVHPAGPGIHQGVARADAVSRTDASGGKIVKATATGHAIARSDARGGISVSGSARGDAVSGSSPAAKKDVWSTAKAYAQAAGIAAGMLALGGAAQADAVSTSTISGIGEFAGNARGDGVSQERTAYQPPQVLALVTGEAYHRRIAYPRRKL
jgi:hypothetical protein